jgi:tRNA threonylcarbamoyladenosine biosynthesis protein TsaB
MALLLLLETSGKMCSVALERDGVLLAEKELGKEYTHAENLTLFIEDVLLQAHVAFSELNAVAVSKGPGSYTGLRIGVSTAKGLCYSLGIPLIAVSTLEAMGKAFIASAAVSPSGPSFYCPLIDARRMEVYSAVYDSSGVEVEPVSAKIIDTTSFAEYLEKGTVYFFGDGAMKCNTLITHPHAVFIADVLPSAKNLISFAEDAFSKKRFEDVAYFEPYYLKEFFTGKK